MEPVSARPTRLLHLVTLLGALATRLAAPTGAAEGPTIRVGRLTREARTITTAQGIQVEVEAGTLAVPENRAHPTARVIEIAYYRLRSTARRPGTPIFLLAGGPGSSWLDQFEQEENFEEVQYYRTISDVVLFDQRGAGRSLPKLSCDGMETLAVDQPLRLDEVAGAMRRLAVSCRDRLLAAGVDLGGLTTVQSAADVDALRAALGYQRMSLIGGSYGSHLALALMRRYPASIDRVVLYGVEGPDHTWDDPGGKLAVLARIAAAAEASPELRAQIPPGGLLAALRTVLERLEAKPVTVTVARDGRDIPVVIDATGARLAVLAQAGRRSRAGAWAALILELYRGDYRRLAAGAVDARTLRIRPDAPMHFTMDCASGISPQRAARYAADPATAIVGDLNFEYRVLCDVWRAPDLGPDFRAPVVSAIPTLVLQGTWDVSTPIENAREVVSTLANGQLVEVVEGSHGAIYNLLAHWEPMKPLLAKFLRGDAVRFPPSVSLPAVSFAPAPGKP
jgi:pimeloyl-ACP methyl ester carboxylesterase